jgi:hypothetical protein
MSAEADQLCEATGNSRNGYRKRKLMTCVGTLTLRIPKLRIGSFFPDDVLERYQRVDRAIVAAVSGCARPARACEGAENCACHGHRAAAKRPFSPTLPHYQIITQATITDHGILSAPSVA